MRNRKGASDAQAKAAETQVKAAETLDGDRPRPEWVRGQCPQCGEPLVANCYYVGTKGYLTFWECWGSLSSTPTCTYRKVIE